MIFGAGGLVKFIGRKLNFKIHSLGWSEFNGKRFYTLSSALAEGDSTDAPAGSLAVTSHATGAGLIFQSNGSTWEIYHSEVSQALNIATITATGATNGYLIAPLTGKLVGVIFSGVDALAADDTNFLTFGITNLGQAGAGSTAILAATDANTTKATNGTALGADTRRDLSLHGTAANLLVTKGDRLKFAATATGTLANTVTGVAIIFLFQPNI